MFNQAKRKLVFLIIFCMMITYMPISASAAEVTDISNHWAQATIQSWVDQGFINGYPDGSFRPDNNITRAEFLALTNRAFGYAITVPISYSDVEVGDWYYDTIAVAVAAGYINGYPDGTMRPESPITREEVATLLMNMDNFTTNGNNANVFSDAASFSWSKVAIATAYTAKLMVGYPDGSFGNKKFIKRGEATVALDNNKSLLQPANNQTNTGPAQGNSLISEALTVISLLANQDSTGLDLYVSPTKGVRFSPYANVNTNTDIVLSSGNSVLNMFTDNTVYTWGNYDGSGNPIAKNPSAYYSEFIYDHDFQNPNMIGINTFIGIGNMINNITTAYPTDSFVEFHFNGFNPQYEGMDWSSLILIFENDNGTWYLTGIVHNQWTI